MRVQLRRWLNALGLILGMIGVVIIFVWGPPQPSFQRGVWMGLQGGTRLPAQGGKTVDEISAETAEKEGNYRFMSRLGLGFVFLGFGCQLGATVDAMARPVQSHVTPVCEIALLNRLLDDRDATIRDLRARLDVEADERRRVQGQLSGLLADKRSSPTADHPPPAAAQPWALRRPRAFWISACNVIGLLCSVAGVVLLFWFALPPRIPGGPSFLTSDRPPAPEWEAENRRYDRNAHIGLGLVIVGTLMEAVPPVCTAIGSWRRRPRAARQRPR
jgi:hypothetical protein